MKIDLLKYKLFEEFCHNYSKDLQKFIFTLTRKDNFVMEEVFQNTMVQALQGLHGLKENEKIKSWLFSIAKTEARRYYSKNKKYKLFENVEISELDWSNGIGNNDFTKAVEDKIFILSCMNQLTIKFVKMILALSIFNFVDLDLIKNKPNYKSIFFKLAFIIQKNYKGF